MTYYLHITQNSTLKARLKFLFRVFHVYFVKVNEERGFIKLQSFPFVDDGICFITGHAPDVSPFLKQRIACKTLVLNTCFPEMFYDLSKDYEELFFCKISIEIPKNRRAPARFVANRRLGSDYNMDFDILDSELLLLYSKAKNWFDRIKESYLQL